jgi:leucyl/phenylalanyl-tRNA--protein transferase
MFSRLPGGSKAALVWIMEHLKQRGFLLHDTQWTTEHLSMFGGQEIARDEYLVLLERAVNAPVRFLG